MLMKREREEIVEVGKLIYERGLVQMSGGNISMRDPETNLVAIKPSGGQYIHMKPEDIIIVDLDGNVVEGSRKPSIETAMHTGIYKARPDINAIVHCHPIHAVAWSNKTNNKVLRSVICAQYMLNGTVAVAPYEAAGSAGLAASAVKAIGEDGFGCILQAHGVICGSSGDIFRAAEMCYVIEDSCQISEIMAMLPGEDFYLDEQLGIEGGYDGVARLKRLEGLQDE